MGIPGSTEIGIILAITVKPILVIYAIHSVSKKFGLPLPKILRFEGKEKRLGFFIKMLSLLLFWALASAAQAFIFDVQETRIPFIALPLFFVVWAFYATCYRRLEDLNKKWTFMLTFLIPLLGTFFYLYLFLAESSERVLAEEEVPAT